MTFQRSAFSTPSRFIGIDPRAAANRILDRTREARTGMAPLALTATLFVAHGFCLARLRLPLVAATFTPTRYGPQIQQVWREVKEYGADPVEQFLDGSSGIDKLARYDAFSNGDLAVRGELPGPVLRTLDDVADAALRISAPILHAAFLGRFTPEGYGVGSTQASVPDAVTAYHFDRLSCGMEPGAVLAVFGGSE